jgi:hypothetical protein
MSSDRVVLKSFFVPSSLAVAVTVCTDLTRCFPGGQGYEVVGSRLDSSRRQISRELSSKASMSFVQYIFCVECRVAGCVRRVAYYSFPTPSGSNSGFASGTVESSTDVRRENE